MNQKQKNKSVGIWLLISAVISFILSLTFSTLSFMGIQEFTFAFLSTIFGFAAAITFFLGLINLIMCFSNGKSGLNKLFDFIKAYYIGKFFRYHPLYERYAAPKNNTKAKGEAGEKEVAYELDHLDRTKSKAIHNFTIKAPNGDAPQIDHLVVTDKGVFHIETKAYEGLIKIDQYGSWTRVINNNTIGEESPLSQIQRHQRALVSLLGNKYPIQPILAIGDKRTIVEGKENFPYPILTLGTIQNYIENIVSTNRTLSYSEREEIYRIIQDALIPNKEF